MEKQKGRVLIRIPILPPGRPNEDPYVRIKDGWVELELFTASAARERLGVSKYIWDGWRRKDAIQSYKVDRTERLYDWHQLDTAATGAGPIREFIRNRDEPIEEANHG